MLELEPARWQDVSRSNTSNPHARADTASGSVAAVFITDRLAERRAAVAPDYLREKLAILDLARVMSDRPESSVA